jgi:hypothetical protein
MATKDAELAKEILKANRRTIIDFVTSKGTAQTRKLLERTEADLLKRLREAEGLSGPGKGTFTPTQLKATLAQVRDCLKQVTIPALKETIVQRAIDASDQSAQHTAEYLNVADRAFRGVGTQGLALKESLMLERAQQGVESSILRRLASSGSGAPGAAPEPHKAKRGILQRYGANVIGEFEGQLQKGLIAKKSWAEMRADLVASSPFLQGAPAHWAARIVRTEVMGAYNRASWESIREADDQLGDMTKILSATFDERTGSDSFAVHGQIRRPDEAFEWWDGMYQHPPNRPNDREIVVPHRVSWVIPATLQWKDPGEILKRWQAERRKGAPPERPKMTTVPLTEFGKTAPPPVREKDEDEEKERQEKSESGEPPDGEDVAEGDDD